VVYSSGREEICVEFLEAGARICLRDAEGLTLLHYAGMWGMKRVAALIFEISNDPDSRDDSDELDRKGVPKPICSAKPTSLSIYSAIPPFVYACAFSKRDVAEAFVKFAKGFAMDENNSKVIRDSDWAKLRQMASLRVRHANTATRFMEKVFKLQDEVLLDLQGLAVHVTQ
jgi:ankyrin repeat protein